MPTPKQIIYDVIKYLERDSEKMEEAKNNPIKILNEIANTHRFKSAIPNTLVYHILIGGLITIVLVIVIGVIIGWVKADKSDSTVPTILTAIGSAAIGALAGILAPNPRQASEEG
jgi:hypothetical protein